MNRLIDRCPLAMAESVTPISPDESTYTAPQLPLPGPHPMSVLHQAALGATARGAPIPDVSIPEPSISSPLPVPPFRPASNAAQSLEGEGWRVITEWLTVTHGLPTALCGSPSSHWTPLVSH